LTEVLTLRYAEVVTISFNMNHHVIART